MLELEAELMRERGVEVLQVFVENADDDLQGIKAKIDTARNCIWNEDARAKVREEIRRTKPDIVHVHNTFVHLSPSVFAACSDEGVPVVQTVHNYRMICAQAAFVRDGRVCRDCVGQFPWPALKHKCYRGSLSATAVLVAMQRKSRNNGTYFTKVDRFIMLSEFMKEIYTRDGFPVGKLAVKEHSAKDPGLGVDRVRANKFVYVGRLVEEKGPDVLIDGWLKAGLNDWELHILGEGDMKESLQRKAAEAGCTSVVWHGWVQAGDVMNHIATSRFLVNSSICYESFGLTVVEALACGTPSIVPGHGAMPVIADAPHVGMTFEPSSGDDLARVLKEAVGSLETDWNRRSAEGRKRFEKRYTHQVNFDNLMAIYQAVLAERSGE